MDIVFDTYKREGWMRIISEFSKCTDVGDSEEIWLCFPNLSVAELRPLHIASLACLIEHFYILGCNIVLEQTEVGEYLFHSLKFSEYWLDKAERSNYTIANDKSVFNLWHITDGGKELYGRYIKDYLYVHFWKGKDLSPVQLSITEACYNTLDHAQADGNAFSFVKYDEVTHILSVAVCDFGIGIANSVKGVYPDFSDEEALKMAINANFTVGTKSYNAGMGLDVIKSSVTDDLNLTIISNRAFLISDNRTTKTGTLDFSFDGTLLEYDMNLSKYDNSDDELLSEVTF